MPLDAILDLRADAKVGSSPLQFDHNTHLADANFDPLDFAAYAESDAPDGYAAAYVSVTATWDSPGLGSVQFGPTGYSTDAVTPDGLVAINGTRWTYRFRTTTENQLTLTYEVDLTDDTTDPGSLHGFRFVVILNAYKPIFDQTLEPGDAGVLVVPLDPDQSYAISLIPHAAVTDNLGTFTAAMVGYFDWEVTESDFTPLGGS